MKSIKTFTHDGQEINAEIEINFCGYEWKGYGTYRYKFDVLVSVDRNWTEEKDAFISHDSQFYDEFKDWSSNNTFGMYDENEKELLDEFGQQRYTDGAGNELNYTSYEAMVARLEDIASERCYEAIEEMAVALHIENLETANEEND